MYVLQKNSLPSFLSFHIIMIEHLFGLMGNGGLEMKYNPDKLIQLSHWLLPEDPTLEEEIRFSIQNPSVYLKYRKQKHGFWKGFQRPTSNLPWFSLIDGLYERNLIFEYDHLAMPSGILANYEQRRSNKTKRWAWIIKEGRWSAEYAWNQNQPSAESKELFIEIASNYLKRVGYVLCELVPSYQPFAMTILDQELVYHCKELADESGYGNLIIHELKQKKSGLSYMNHIPPLHVRPLDTIIWKM